MTDRREISLDSPAAISVLAILVLMLLINRKLDRIATALERAYPAQEQKP